MCSIKQQCLKRMLGEKGFVISRDHGFCYLNGYHYHYDGIRDFLINYHADHEQKSIEFGIQSIPISEYRIEEKNEKIITNKIWRINDKKGKSKRFY